MPPYAGDTLSLLKQLAPNAKILLSIPLSVNPFELRADEGSEKFCHEIELCVRDDLYDGIDLDFNAFVLEFADQIIFSQFLEKLRQRLRSKIIISLSLDAQQFSSNPLGNAIIQNVDFVVTSKDESFVDGNQGEEFVVRRYLDSAIDRLLQGGIPAEKIVLGLQTAGIVTNPSEQIDMPIKKCAIVGLIPYGQVCELRDQRMRFCSWHSDRQCLLFDGKSKLIYDNLDAVKDRAVQCTKRGLKGVSILLNYDDSVGLCGEEKFPMLGAIDEILSQNGKHSGAENSKNDNKIACEQHKIDDEMHRLELAIEKLEDSTNLLQKIAHYLLRALYKLIDVMVSFVKKPTEDDSRKTADESGSKDLGLDESDENEDKHDTQDVSIAAIVENVNELAQEQKIPEIVSSEINKQHAVEAEESLKDNPISPPVVDAIGGHIPQIHRSLIG